MPITFGSVGDIISVCLLVKDLVDVLDKSKGSSAEYHAIIRELWLLDRALLEIEKLSRTHSQTVELNALRETARRTVENCRISIENFTKQTKKYESTLSEKNSSNAFTKTVMKVRWRVSEKDEIARFRAEVAAHTSSMNMLLATANVNLVQLNDEKLHTRLADTEEKMHDTLDHQSVVLAEVRDRLEKNNQLVSAGNAMATKIAEALRFQWLTELGQELKSFMRKIYMINVATYKVIVSLQAGLPSQLEGRLIQEPFILEDAIGRIAPVHPQFITSWEAFYSVLEIRFQDIQGLRKIRNKEFILQDHTTCREVDSLRRWESAFLPGRRYNMSMVFIRKARKGQEAGLATCPQCGKVSDQPTDKDIQCDACAMWYRRVTEIHEIEPPPESHLHPHRNMNISFGQCGFSTGSPTFTTGEAAESSLDPEDDIIECFKRVRLVSREDRFKIPSPSQAPFLDTKDALWPEPSVAGSSPSWAQHNPSISAIPLRSESQHSTTDGRNEGSNEVPTPTKPLGDMGCIGVSNTTNPINQTKAHASLFSTIDEHDKSSDADVLMEDNINKNTDQTKFESDDGWDNWGSWTTSKSKKKSKKEPQKESAISSMNHEQGDPAVTADPVRDGNAANATVDISDSYGRRTINAESNFLRKPFQDPRFSGYYGYSGYQYKTPPDYTPYGYIKTPPLSPSQSSYSYYSPRCSTSTVPLTPRRVRETYYHAPQYTSDRKYRQSRRRYSSQTTPNFFDNPNVHDDYLYDSGNEIPYFSYHNDTPVYTEATPTSSRLQSRRTSHAAPQPKQPKSREKVTAFQKAREPTVEDARRAGIPSGYSLKYWDPTEEPITLVGSVFDGNSFGKWVYDWAVFHYGPSAPMSDIAGELWLLLIQLAGKIKRADECMPYVRKAEDREMVEEFSESGERLWLRFNKLVKSCEGYMWKAHKAEQKKSRLVAKEKAQSAARQDQGQDMKHTGGKVEEVIDAEYKPLHGSQEMDNRVDIDIALDTGAENQESKREDEGRAKVESKCNAEVIEVQEDIGNENEDDKHRGRQEHRGKEASHEGDVTSKATNCSERAQKNGSTNSSRISSMGKSSAIAFIESLFGKDRELEQTEKVMHGIRLWSTRFDANCEDILRCSRKGYSSPAPESKQNLAGKETGAADSGVKVVDQDSEVSRSMDTACNELKSVTDQPSKTQEDALSKYEAGTTMAEASSGSEDEASSCSQHGTKRKEIENMIATKAKRPKYEVKAEGLNIAVDVTPVLDPVSLTGSDVDICSTSAVSVTRKRKPLETAHEQVEKRVKRDDIPDGVTSISPSVDEPISVTEASPDYQPARYETAPPSPWLAIS
ncbi:hypothetical protein AOQ84DRAFT_392540 [Glonium stellatum]|uniref:Ubiquitin-like domain-containing protein n=1 Tax=Glonium stellatum TaxID=574774 RepID=A0A8E2JNB4_9PEZI|nr:hypothetical protein AOQ84DRAFT_392540 [Glonium stellatum]